MGALSWAFAISDRMSGPAASAAKGVDKVTASLQKADKATKKFEASQGRARDANGRFVKGGDALVPTVPGGAVAKLSMFQRMIQGIGSIGGPSAVNAAMSLSRALVSVDSAVGKANGVLGIFGTSVGGVGSKLGGVASAGAMAFVGAIAAVTAALAAAAAAVVYFGAKAVIAFTKFGMQSLSFRENAMVAFETMLGTADAADRLYGKAVDFAAKTPFRTDQIVGAYQKLLVGGFKTNELETIMKAVGDVAAMKGFDASKMDEMIRGFAKLRGMGKLTGEVMEMESFRGIAGKIYEQLGKDMGGKSVDAVRKAMSDGKIDSAMAEKAIIEVIRTTYSGGTLGMAMEKFSSMWTGIWSTATSRPQELFEAAGKNVKGGLATYFNAFKDAGKWLGDALDPKSDSGQRVVAIINSIGKALSDMLGKFDAKEASASFDRVLTIVETVLPLIESFGKGFKEGLLSGLGPLMKAFDSIDGKKASDIEKTAEAFRILGEALGFVVGAGATISAAFVSVVAQIAYLPGRITVFASELVDTVTGMPSQVLGVVMGLAGQMFAAGISVPLGLADGIRAGIGMAVSAATEMANAVLNATRVAHDSHSPSRKFHELGMFAGEGLAGGMDASAPRVKASVYDMVTPPTPRQLPAAGMSSRSRSSGDGASGGKSVVFHLGSNAIVINGTGDRAEIKSGILEAFEEIALEFGQ